MAAKTIARSLPVTYFKLVERFPLVHIADDDQLEAASSVIDGLLQENLDAGGQAYLDALTDLVERYEAEHVEIADVSEADVLRELMRSHGLSQNRLAKAVGIAQSTISAVLNGHRSLTKEHVIALAAFFQVEASAFLPA